ncbi:hypothetical protein QY049_15720 [Bradyrhizobium sp. WYCCWR 13022]|uniref:hypothetical protein n=1 Tax=unclassified Bradyrhizobium TaxID=2631580 RepID=UPI00263A7CA1|nr:hypothetical protein [Bradyrhizobium sp. WYCCWR 13022]MDN4984651.1 hypothetical protein [Bradyrhizobium sp. WYCCWR 13022]
MDETTLNRLRVQDRAELDTLRCAINATGSSLKRDECGDWTLSASRGAVRVCDGVYRAYVGCRSARHWGSVKKSLDAFCTVTLDGDQEGIVRIDRVPAEDQAHQLRDAIGLRRAPSFSTEHRLALSQRAQSWRGFAAGHEPKSDCPVSGARTSPSIVPKTEVDADAISHQAERTV